MKLLAGTLDRRSYWIAVLLVIAIRLGGGLLANERLIAPSLGRAVDWATLVVLAAVLAKRFRNFGWPGWIGVIALIGTAVLPFALYLFLNGGPRARTRDAVVESWAGTASSLLLLMLVVLTGLPGTSRSRPDRRAPAERIEPRF